MSDNVNIRDHQMWLGYLQPEGLVVSPAALVDSQVILPRDSAERQQEFLAWIDGVDSDAAYVSDFPTFAEAFLGWSSDILVLAGEDLEHAEPGMEEVLRPTYALRNPNPKDPANPYVLLVQSVPKGTDLDKVTTGDAAAWSASPTQRFLRLLQAKEVPIGILENGTQVRLIYAPKSESPGWLTFPVQAMSEVAGRPVLAAFHLLLERYRLIGGPENARLPALLIRSRQYQSTVSTQLAGQVLDALYELLRGFESANERSKGRLLEKTLAENPNEIYHGLLTVLMRLVFLLYAEDKGVMPNTDLYNQNFSVHGLHERLRQDQERYPDTMGDRFGAWAQLLTLFRAIYQGCDHPLLNMPARHGYLFDPARFPFLDGASIEGEIPLVPDGTIYAVLKELLVLNGERLSYRTLDVEQMGSVYEVMMGFRLLVADGPSVALKPKKKLGAPTVINLDALLAVKGSDRAKWLKEQADQEVSAANAKPLVEASSVDDLAQALQARVALAATPHMVKSGALLLQPGEDRRRSGTNYTPRSLTEPIVGKTLEPILDRLGPDVTPLQILDLKVCDPAMGSGAFLVAVCRSLGELLVKSWERYKSTPPIPEGETALLVAMRMVAQRCVYGVDKNPMATELAKLSLWLVTLAKDHAFTFLDHNLRAGDSLVGLTNEAIFALHWDAKAPKSLFDAILPEQIKQSSNIRLAIGAAGEGGYDHLVGELEIANSAIEDLRLVGDSIIAAFFSKSKPKERLTSLEEVSIQAHALFEGRTLEEIETARERLRAWSKWLGEGEKAVTPFHWELEFPEVFLRPIPGFDAMIGNPPFYAGAWLQSAFSTEYRAYLVEAIASGRTGIRGTADLCTYFLIRCVKLISGDGSLGLLLSSTVLEGDSYEVGINALAIASYNIFGDATAFTWPGAASVDVVRIWIAGRQLKIDASISSHFKTYHSAGKAHQLAANSNLICKGHELQGEGFKLSPQEALALSNDHESFRLLIRPLVLGEELNETPQVEYIQYVINASHLTLDQLIGMPEVNSLLEARVKSDRLTYTKDTGRDKYLRTFWWRFRGYRKELEEYAAKREQLLAASVHTKFLSLRFIPSDAIPTPSIFCFLSDRLAFFACLQGRCHEVWSAFNGSTLGGTPRYIAGRCFETFPFPKYWETDPNLEAVGKEYYEFRAELMIRNNEGLTKTYNRFHDPSETSPEILRLRELHEAMDRAVLAAYGWPDIPTACEFLLDYEEDEPDEADQDLFGQPKKKGKGKKKPYRYRWPDEVRDEVLARLLALNAERHAEEVRLGIAPGMGKKKGKAANSGGLLYDEEDSS